MVKFKINFTNTELLSMVKCTINIAYKNNFIAGVWFFWYQVVRFN
jgi:hypothetical protein